jgi:hypothetical protein
MEGLGLRVKNLINRHKRWSFPTKFAIWLGIISLVLTTYFSISGSLTQNKMLNTQNKILELIEHTDNIYSPSLLQKYPLGYVLFAIQNGKENITFTKDRLSKEFIINWNTAKVGEITNDKITLRCPDMKFIDSDITFTGVGLGFPRKIGIPFSIIRSVDINVMGELLVDENENFICVLGFRRDTKG